MKITNVFTLGAKKKQKTKKLFWGEGGEQTKTNKQTLNLSQQQRQRQNKTKKRQNTDPHTDGNFLVDRT